jgi:hypothetical protein
MSGDEVGDEGDRGEYEEDHEHRDSDRAKVREDSVDEWLQRDEA